MATGFRPKYERTIELAGYSSEELMLLAIEASKSLGWQAGSIKRDKSDFYTPTSFRSWQEKVILSVTDGKDGQLLATSICTSMQFMDWGKNKQNLNKLTATMQQLQNVHNISPTEADTANKTTCAYTPEEKNTVISHIRHFYGGIKGITKTLFHRQEWKSSLLNQQAGLTAIHWLHVEQVLLLCRCRIKQPLRGVSSVCVCHQHGIQKTHGRLTGFCNVSHGFNKGIPGLHVGIRCPMVHRCRMILS